MPPARRRTIRYAKDTSITIVPRARGAGFLKRTGAFCFDTFQNGYYAIGEKVGEAWGSGKALMHN